METLDLPFEITSVKTSTKDSAGNEVGSFEGLAAAFNNQDMVGDVIMPGAFKGSIRSPKKIKMLWQHQSDQPVGVWTGFIETDKGLHAEGKLVLDVQRAAEAHALMKAGAVDGLSIGFRIPAKGSVFDRETGIRTITKIDLWEISLVTFPANPKARVSRVKMLNDVGELPTPREMEAALRDMGFSRRQSRAFMSKGFAGLDPEAAAAEELAERIQELTDDIRSAIPTP